MAKKKTWLTIASFKHIAVFLFFLTGCYFLPEIWNHSENAMYSQDAEIILLYSKDEHIHEFAENGLLMQGKYRQKGVPYYNLGEENRPLLTRDDSPTISNHSKCYSVSNAGPILRTVEITKATNGTSNCTVFGDGLLRATVGKPAHITIRTHGSKRKELYTKFVFSVLAVGEKHIFYASPSELNESTLEINFTYVPTVPGRYDLFVEEMSRKWQRQLPGSPFKLVVDGPSSIEEEMKKKADQLPSCQTLPQTDLSWSEGNWVTRDLAGEKRGTLRSGWVLQPTRCSIDIFTRRDLELAAASKTLKTIVILGRSTERGVFSSLVDVLLRKDEKENLGNSVVWKCWGFMELRLGNLRFIYQDFRIEGASMKTVKDKHEVNITCHNEKKVSSNNDFFGDAIGFFQETLFTEEYNPDVVLLIVTNALQLKLLTKVIPSSWKGTLYAMNGFKCHEASLYTFKGRQADLDLAKEFVPFDRRIRVLDGFAVATPMRHNNEAPPLIMKPMHWHRPCNEQNGEMLVCGDGTEMVGQILLGKALAPNGKDVWLSSLEKCDLGKKNTTREIKICHDCPRRIFPVHIKRKPDPICYNSSKILAVQRKDVQAWDGSLCPSECMKTSPVGQEDIRSGTVDVRICTVLRKESGEE